MKMTWLTILILLIPTHGFSTSFAPMSLENRVKGSSIIAEGEIVSLQCLDPKGQNVAIGKRCTGPGNPNQLSYVFRVKRVLKDSTKYFKGQTLPLNLNFKFSSMAHLSVPEDNYESAKGKKKIVFLRWIKDELKPVHQAFYLLDAKHLPKVEQTLKKGPE